MLTTQLLILLVVGLHTCSGGNPEERNKGLSRHQQHEDESSRNYEGNWSKRDKYEPSEFYGRKHNHEHKEKRREKSYDNNEVGQEERTDSEKYKREKWSKDKTHAETATLPKNSELVKTKEESHDMEERRSELQREENKKITIQHLPAFSAPPDPNNTVLMARYIVHSVDWAGLATVTTRGYGGPFSNVVSMSDGTVDDGTGVPYFYITPKDLSTQDIAKDNRASVAVTLAQTEYCRTHTPSALDPEDPRCARVILSGKIKRVKPSSPEDEFARNALFTRHPAMRDWPKDHGFYVAKLKIGQVILLDQFGGPKYVDVKEYLSPQPQRE